MPPAEGIAFVVSFMALGLSIMSFIYSDNTRTKMRIEKLREAESDIIKISNGPPPEIMLVDTIPLGLLSDKEFINLCRGTYMGRGK